MSTPRMLLPRETLVTTLSQATLAQDIRSLLPDLTAMVAHHLDMEADHPATEHPDLLAMAVDPPAMAADLQAMAADHLATEAPHPATDPVLPTDLPDHLATEALHLAMDPAHLTAPDHTESGKNFIDLIDGLHLFACSLVYEITVRKLKFLFYK